MLSSGDERETESERDAVRKADEGKGQLARPCTQHGHEGEREAGSRRECGINLLHRPSGGTGFLNHHHRYGNY